MYFLVVSFFEKKILFSFHSQKTDEKWGQNFQKNFKHLPFAQKKTPLGLLDNTFLHNLCKFEQNRSSRIQEILTTAKGLAENGLRKKYITSPFLDIFT